MEPGGKSLEIPSTQASNGLVFGIVLGSGLQANTKNFTSSGTSIAQTNGKAFGSIAGKTSYIFGQTSAIGDMKIPSGTVVSFHPASGEDTMMKRGVTTSIQTKHQCITAMKEYENKSLEELRMEDYSGNRRSKQRVFGTPAARTYSLFGHTYAANSIGYAANAVGFSRIPVGTTVSFNPPSGKDTMMKSGVTTSIHTKHQCITAMKEYEDKSLEELRMEDYSLNRRSKQRVSSVRDNGCEFGSEISRRDRQYIQAPRKW